MANQLERMQARLAKHATKKRRGRPPKIEKPIVVIPRPIVPPPPVKIQEREVGLRSELTETLSLIGGRELHPGDVIVQERRFVIREITKSDGVDTVRVEAECIKRSWKKYNSWD